MSVAVITWITPEGDLGTYSSGQSLSLQLSASSSDPTSLVRYEWLSGNWPAGTSSHPITLTSEGFITGTLAPIPTRQTDTFTVRAYDQYGNMRDRTFSFTVTNNIVPRFVTSTGALLTTVDSVYVTYQVGFTNPVPSNVVVISVASGELPPGLRMDSNGFISGYAEPPVLFDKSPTTRTYTFSLQLTSDLGNDVSTFSITVSNYQIDHPSMTRIPVILNYKPKIYPIPLDDVFYDYYIDSDGMIGTINANEYFSYKILGYDFDGSNITYEFFNLPTGLSGDTVTGWITGTIVMNSFGVNNYQFFAKVHKTDNPSLVSDVATFNLVVSNQLKNDIKWVTDSNLGSIDNGSISELTIKATSSKELVYTLTQGTLPPNLLLTETGDLTGRIAFQPTTEMLSVGANSVFSFTVVAYASEYPLLKSEKQFTLTVKQRYDRPSESIYMKASPSVSNRQILKTLLTDETIIPASYLYRPNDLYFGKARDIRFVHAYGVEPASLSTYIAATQNNHYTRRLFLGDIKLAVARDENSNVVYQVVYADILDDLVNPSGKSVSSTITWPTPINYNNTTITTVKPSSIDNMKKEVLSHIPYDSDISLLPKWMNTQQLNGETTGYVRGWVICYAKYEPAIKSYDADGTPIYYLHDDGTTMTCAERIKYNIENNWQYDLNSIEFLVDRYLVDKSATYDWNLTLQIPTWSELPSATPAPATLEDKNMSVLFPKKSII